MKKKTLFGIIAALCVCAAIVFFAVDEVAADVLGRIAFRRGIAALQQRQNTDAVSAFTTAISHFWQPEWRTASLVERAVGYRSLKQYDQALTDLTEALAENPNQVHALLLRAYVHDEKGERELAFADYQKVLQLDPNSAPGWYRSALYQENAQKDYTAARKSFREAIRCEPRHMKAYVGSAYCSDRLGDRDGAIAGYDAAVGVSPNDAYPYAARAKYWVKQKDYDRALAELNRALELDPANKGDLYERSVVFSRTHNYPAQIADLSALLALDPRHEWALQDRGMTHRAMTDYAAAISDFTELIKLTQASEAYTDRARTYARAGNFEAARADYEQAAHHSSGHVTKVSKSLAWFLATCPDAAYRDGPRAIELATKECEKSDWKNANDLDTMAAAEAEMGQFDKAADHERQVIELMEDYPTSKVVREGRLALYLSHRPYRDTPLAHD